MVNRTEYHKILFELGILDDEEDWELYQTQEKELSIDDDLYMKYVNTRYSKQNEKCKIKFESR